MLARQFSTSFLSRRASGLPGRETPRSFSPPTQSDLFGEESDKNINPRCSAPNKPPCSWDLSRGSVLWAPQLQKLMTQSVAAVNIRVLLTRAREGGSRVGFQHHMTDLISFLVLNGSMFQENQKNVGPHNLIYFPSQSATFICIYIKSLN